MVVDSLISLWRDRLVDNPHQTTKYVLYVCVGGRYVSVEGANWLLKHPKAWTKGILSVNFHRVYSVRLSGLGKEGETQGNVRIRPRDWHPICCPVG